MQYIALLSIDHLYKFITVLPGIILGAFSFYFAYPKIGKKVLVTYSTSMDRISEERISEITLINKKNKPLTVFSIHAVVEKDVVIEVERFKPPLILKPLESVFIQTTPFSSLHIGSDIYNANYILHNNIDIYLISDNEKILCQTITPPDISKMFNFRDFKQTIKSTKRFNDIVYNESVKFAITYSMNNQTNTSFIHHSGQICNNWKYRYNMIPNEYMTSVEKVTEYLYLAEFDKFTNGFHVDDLSC